MKCKECNRPFPAELIQPMFVINGYIKVCPLCALEIRNSIHGLNDAEFQGEMANMLLEEARKIYPN